MPKFFDLANNQPAFDKLQKIKNDFLAEQEREREERRQQLIREHRRTHIFDTVEEALDWCIANPGKILKWYCDEIYWDEQLQIYIGYGQDFDISGVIPYDIKYRSTRQEFIDRHNAHIERMNEKYPEQADKQWWLDEYGKLNYISL